MALPKVIANFETSLANKMSSSASSFTLSTSTDPEGVTLSGTYSLTFDEGESSEEHMIVTLAGASGTVTTRGLSRTDAKTNVAGNQFEHARGSSVKVTNVSLINVVRRLNGDEAFDSPNLTGMGSIAGLATPTSGETTKAANVDYVNNTANAGAADAADNVKGIVERATQTEINEGAADGSGDTTAPLAVTAARHFETMDTVITRDFNAGENLTAAQWVVLDTSDKQWYLLDTDDAAQVHFKLGVVKETATSGNPVRVQINGVVTGLTGLTAGKLYASSTAGTVSNSIGSIKRFVGWALDANTAIIVDAFRPEDLSGTSSGFLDSVFNEMGTFFQNTDITGAQAETLSDGSNADSLHKHDLYTNLRKEQEAKSVATAIYHKPFSEWTTVNNSSTLTEFVSFTLFETGANSGNDIIVRNSLGAQGNLTVGSIDWDLNCKITFVVKCESNASQDLFFGFGDSSTCATEVDADATNTARHAGIYIADGTIYASCADGTTQITPVDVSAGITLTDVNQFEVEFTAGSSAVVRINGTQVASLETQLPSGSVSTPQVIYGATTRTSSRKGFVLYNNYITQVEMT